MPAKLLELASRCTLAVRGPVDYLHAEEMLSGQPKPEAVLLAYPTIDNDLGEFIERLGTWVADAPVFILTTPEKLEATAVYTNRIGPVGLLPDDFDAEFVLATVVGAARMTRSLAIERYEAMCARNALEVRKLIERASGVLMRRTGSDSAKARELMQHHAKEQHLDVADVALEIMLAEKATYNDEQRAKDSMTVAMHKLRIRQRQGGEATPVLTAPWRQMTTPLTAFAISGELNAEKPAQSA